jgi:hypothetical protein
MSGAIGREKVAYGDTIVAFGDAPLTTSEMLGPDAADR